MKNVELKLGDFVICRIHGKKHYCKVVQMNFILYLMDREDPRRVFDIEEAEDICVM